MMKESNRQKKFGKLILKEMSEMLQRELTVVGNPMLTVTVVRATADLGIARVYISAFPDAKGPGAIEDLMERKGEIRMMLASRIRKQVRHIPDLQFYLDDTAQEVAHMDQLFGQLNPDEEAS